MEDQEKKSTKYCHTEDNKHLLVSYVDKQKTVKKKCFQLYRKILE